MVGKTTVVQVMGHHQTVDRAHRILIVVTTWMRMATFATHQSFRHARSYFDY